MIYDGGQSDDMNDNCEERPLMIEGPPSAGSPYRYSSPQIAQEIPVHPSVVSQLTLQHQQDLVEFHERVQTLENSIGLWNYPFQQSLVQEVFQVKNDRAAFEDNVCQNVARMGELMGSCQHYLEEMQKGIMDRFANFEGLGSHLKELVDNLGWAAQQSSSIQDYTQEWVAQATKGMNDMVAKFQEMFFEYQGKVSHDLEEQLR